MPLRAHSLSRISALSCDLLGVSGADGSGFFRENTDPARSRIREIPNGVDSEVDRDPFRSDLLTGDRTGKNRFDR